LQDPCNKKKKRRRKRRRRRRRRRRRDHVRLQCYYTWRACVTTGSGFDRNLTGTLLSHLRSACHHLVMFTRT
jgi:hypothetical protein